MKKRNKLLAALIVVFCIGCTAMLTEPTETNPEEISTPPTEVTSEKTNNDTTDANQKTESSIETEEPTTGDERSDGSAVNAETGEELASPPQGSTFSIRFIDVGQADAALVECDGHYMLVDGGNKSDSNVIYSILKSAKVPKLDIVVGSHAHEDHIGGLPGAFNYTSADVTLCPVKNYDSDAFNDFKKYADQKGGGITVPAIGDKYSLGSATITILGVNGGSEVNDTSIVMLIQYGQTKFLFTGDAERDAEQAIINSGVDMSATVLKVGHHGSDTSTSYLFLRNAAPLYAVISVGDGNSYGHPTEDVLSRLRDADVTVFRTDLQGDISCTSDGTTVSFTVERNEDADTLVPPLTQIAPDPTPSQSPNEDGGTDNNTTQEHNFVGNKNSKKFHYDWCNSVDRMKESNKYYYTGTREGMISQGYEPCGNCKP